MRYHVEIRLTHYPSVLDLVLDLVHDLANNKRMEVNSAKGEFTVPENFNDPLPKEIEDLFYE